MKISRHRSLVLLVGLLLSVAGLRAQLAFTGLTLINPFNDPSGSIALAVNANGVVLGNDSSDRNFIWSAGVGTEIVNTLGDRRVEANGINAAGQVVGQARDSSVPRQAFIWSSGGGMTAIANTLSASHAEASKINAAGTVVGRVDNVGPDENRSVAFRWTSAGGMVELANPAFATGDSAAYGINQHNQVAGLVYGENYDGIAVRWDSDGSATLLPTPDGWRMSDARGINSAGWIAGTVVDDEGAFYRPFFWDGDEFHILGTLSEDSSAFGLAINDSGQMVGESDSGAFLFSDGEMFALNDLATAFLVDGTTVGFHSLLYAFDINNAGQIVGMGEYFDGVDYVYAGFLLTTAAAIPEPSTYAALAGVIVLGLAIWRRRVTQKSGPC